MVPCRSVWAGACAGGGGGAGGGDCCAQAAATANSTIGIPMRRARLFMSITNRAREQSQDHRDLQLHSASDCRAARKNLQSARSITANPSAAERELPPRRPLKDEKIRCGPHAESCVREAEGRACQRAECAARRTVCRQQPDARWRKNARESCACVPRAILLQPACSDPGAQSRANRCGRAALFFLAPSFVFCDGDRAKSAT